MGFSTLYATLCLGFVGSISPPWLESRITNISLHLLGACIANTNTLVHGFALHFSHEGILLGVELLGVRVLSRLVVAQEAWPTWTLMALSGASRLYHIQEWDTDVSWFLFKCYSSTTKFYLYLDLKEAGNGP